MPRFRILRKPLSLPRCVFFEVIPSTLTLNNWMLVVRYLTRVRRRVAPAISTPIHAKVIVDGSGMTFTVNGMPRLVPVT